MSEKDCKYCGHRHYADPHYCIARLQEDRDYQADARVEDLQKFQSQLATLREENERLRKFIEWPRCLDCSCELTDFGEGVGMICRACQKDEIIDQLKAQLDAAESRVKELESKAAENEKVFLTANANFADERMRLEGQLAASKLKWQTGKPKVRGYYWFTDIDEMNPTQIKHVVDMRSDPHWLDSQIFKWAGPIPEPEEK